MWLAYNLCVLLVSLLSLDVIPSASSVRESAVLQERHVHVAQGLCLLPETPRQGNQRFRDDREQQGQYSRGKRGVGVLVGPALSFVSNGISFLFKYVTNEKRKAEQMEATKLIMGKLQTSLELRLKGIEDEIVKNRILTNYGDVEEGIRQAIDAYEQYKLTNEDESLNKMEDRRKVFFNKAEELPKNLEKLMRGFLGEISGLFQLDLLKHFYSIIGCQGRRFRNNMEALASLIHSAIFVYLDYVKESNPTVVDLNDLPFVVQWDAMYKKLGTRVEEFLLRCRKSADVTEDIRSATVQACTRVVHDHYCPPDVAQRAVRDRLESEYGYYDRWIVSAFSSKTSFHLSPRFRTVIFHELGLVVTAFAIDRMTPPLSIHPLVVHQLRLFRPNYDIAGGNPGLKLLFLPNGGQLPFVRPVAKNTYTQLRAFLAGLSAINGTHLEIGVFLGKMDRCADGGGAFNLTDKHPSLQEIGGALVHPLGFDSSAAIVTNTSTRSDGAVHSRDERSLLKVCGINRNSNGFITLSDDLNEHCSKRDYWLGSGVDCGYSTSAPPMIFDVLVIPVPAEQASARNFIEPNATRWISWMDEEGFTYLLYRMVGFLAVKYDSDREGALVVLETNLTLSRGQRWKFHNGQLVNGHGLCLTAWYNTHFGTVIPFGANRLYQYKCSHWWEGQRWRLSGTQLVNDVYPNDPVHRQAYCMTITVSLEAVRTFCTSSNYWTSWAADNDVAYVDRDNDDASKPIRNVGNALYLSLYKDLNKKRWHFGETYSLLHTNHWNGERDQKWRFLNGQLKNDDDQCVAIDISAGFVRVVKCGDKDETQRLAYNNATKQIFGTKGIYCLGLNLYNWHEIEYGKCAENLNFALYQWDF